MRLWRRNGLVSLCQRRPNPTSGWYAIVRASDTLPLDMPVEDAFKLLISGGDCSS